MNMHRPDPAARRVAALIEENEILREEVRLLRQVLAPPLMTPREWGFTPSEDRLLSALRSAGTRIVSRERAIVALCNRDDDMPEDSIVTKMICCVRLKLRKANQAVEIKTVWAQGYHLTPEGLATLNAALAAEARLGDLSDGGRR